MRLALVFLGGLIVIAFGRLPGFAPITSTTSPYLLADRAIRSLDWEHLSFLFTTFSNATYTPLHRLSLALDWALWGDSQAGVRTSSLLLHWVAACLVFLFFHELTKKPLVGWVTALCFALHPTQIESLAGSTGRSDILGVIFGMTSLWLFQRSQITPENPEMTALAATVGHKWMYLGSCLAFVAALTSSPLWIAGFPLLLALNAFEHRRIEPRFWPRLLPFAMLTAVFGWLNFRAQATFTGKSIGIAWALIANPFDRLLEYLQHGIWPVALCPHAPEPPWSNFRTGLGLLVLGVLVLAALSSFRRGRREVFFGISWFFCFFMVWTLFPVAFPPGDRVFYGAISGLAFPLGTFLARQKRGWHLTANVVLCLGLVLLSWNYLPTWRTERSYWETARKKYPYDVGVLTCIIEEQLKVGDFIGARQNYQLGLAITSKSGSIYPRMYWAGAKLEGKTGGNPLSPLSQALGEAPFTPELMAWKGLWFTQLKNYEQAEYYLTVAYKIGPNVERGNELAKVYTQWGSVEKGIPLAELATTKYPLREDYWLTLGRLWEKQGNLEGATRAYRRSAELDPTFVEPRVCLARLALQEGNASQAETLLTEVRGRIGGNQLPPDALQVLATAYHNQGKNLPALTAQTEATRYGEKEFQW
ncbi:MAG: hypothetical protein K1Y36_20370 [Blastocatellia bacterium]|nr:hypothetical protein [Blastocatellia bacterium]